MIQDYIFTNEIGEIVEEVSFYDDDIADNYCQKLADRMKQIIKCYRHISEYGPDD